MANKQKTIGIVGGGQLGRMLTLAAIPLGFKVVVVDPNENSPAAQVGAEEITADFHDEAAIRELGKRADYITVDLEHINTAALESLAGLGVAINPAPSTIALIQDKLEQKMFLADNGVPVAPFIGVESYEQGKAVLENFGGKMVVKTRRGGYDGRGNMVVSDLSELKQALVSFGDRSLFAEQFVPFEKELAVMAARGLDGDIVTYPVVETVHVRNICTEVLSPAPVSTTVSAKAKKIATQVAGLMRGAGMFGIEMFLTDEGEVIVNEIAPRVHNSGHVTLNANRTSQFEQHVRAITGLPLGDTAMTTPAAVMVNILGEDNHPTELKGLEEALAVEGTFVHLYGKTPTKTDRKMGHINSVGSTIEQARTRARKARKLLDI